MIRRSEASLSARAIPDDWDRRFLPGHIALVKRAEGDTAKIIRGLGVVYNVETVIGGRMWGFREIIRPGAFTTTMTEEDQRAFFNHDVNLILARRSAETLRLAEDDKGVSYEIDPPDTSYANDLIVSLERKDVTGSSFMFSIKKQQWTEPDDNSDELPLREVLEATLYELGPVTFPAYEASEASVGARAKAREFHEGRQQRRSQRSAQIVVPAMPDVAVVEATADEIGAIAARAKSAQLRARIAELS